MRELNLTPKNIIESLEQLATPAEIRICRRTRKNIRKTDAVSEIAGKEKRDRGKNPLAFIATNAMGLWLHMASYYR